MILATEGFRSSGTSDITVDDSAGGSGASATVVRPGRARTAPIHSLPMVMPGPVADGCRETG